MKEEKGFSISKFAKFSRTKRGTLLFYDRIGLLRPDSRGRNSYRSYSSDQLAIVNLIHTCRELGISVDEIKKLIAHRTPILVGELLEQQIKRVDEKINEWIRARKLLSVLKNTIHSARDADTDAITVESLPTEAIIYGELNDYSQGKDDYDALFDFYLSFSKKYPDMDLNYPVWGVFSEDRVRRGDITWPDRYYFHNPEGFDRRPAALYVIGYGRGGYGSTANLYRRLMAYIHSNGYEICGPAYEEYPLNEICISDPSDYLIRVMITVRKRDSKNEQIY